MPEKTAALGNPFDQDVPPPRRSRLRARLALGVAAAAVTAGAFGGIALAAPEDEAGCFDDVTGELLPGCVPLSRLGVGPGEKEIPDCGPYGAFTIYLDGSDQDPVVVPACPDAVVVDKSGSSEADGQSRGQGISEADVRRAPDYVGDVTGGQEDGKVDEGGEAGRDDGVDYENWGVPSYWLYHTNAEGVYVEEGPIKTEDQCQRRAEDLIARGFLDAACGKYTPAGVQG